MRSILILIALSLGLVYSTAAKAKTCNAGGGCTITCSGGCACIRFEDGSGCSCYCEEESGSVSESGGPSIDFQGLNWANVRKNPALVNLLRKSLKDRVINCLAKASGPITIKASGPRGKDLYAEVSPVCR